MLKLSFILLPFMLSSCATTSNPEVSVLTSDTTVKSCGYTSLDSAKYGATIQYLEKQGMFVRSNNNSICNNLGCMQEEEIRSFSKDNIKLIEQAYDRSTNCHYFKINKLNTGKKTGKNLTVGNHEGRFDISNESTRSFISINVLNVKDPVLAKMNGKFVMINNSDDIVIKGKKTLKFVINTVGFEKKEFVIKTSDKPEKIVKNITLVRDSRKVSDQEDVGYGFHIEDEPFRLCKVFGYCKHKEFTTKCIVNDRPLDTRMITEDPDDLIGESRQYFLFSDANLHKAFKYCYKSKISGNGNLIVQLETSNYRKGEFMKTGKTAMSSYESYLQTRLNTPGDGLSDAGSAPMLRLYFEVSAYDKFGNLIGTKDHYIHLRTKQGRPYYYDYDHWIEPERIVVFNNRKYLDDWTIRIKAKFKLSASEPKGYPVYDHSNTYNRSPVFFRTNDSIAYDLKALKKYFPEK